MGALCTVYRKGVSEKSRKVNMFCRTGQNDVASRDQKMTVAAPRHSCVAKQAKGGAGE